MSTQGILLAIEASQRRGGVAVRDRDGADHVEWLDASSMHDDDMIAAIDRLYARLRLAPADTSTVGVSVGPGGFTGLRVAVATAKMLAESLDARLVAVPTALVVAERRTGAGPIAVVLASKGTTAWVTRLDNTGPDGSWRIAGEGCLADAHAIDIDGLEAVLGDRHMPDELRTRCRASGVPVAEPVFDPLACLAVAHRLASAGRTIDALSLAPIYARPPAVTVRPDRDRYRA